MSKIDPATPQLELVKGWFDAFLSGDVGNIQSRLSKNFKYQTLPKTPELPDQIAEEYIEKYRQMFSLFGNVEANIHEVIEAPGKVVIQFTGACSTADGDRVEYDSLATFTTIEEDGELKILGIRDFCDPKKRSDFHVCAAKVLAKGGYAA